jgi:hypothetical protein
MFDEFLNDQSWVWFLYEIMALLIIHYTALVMNNTPYHSVLACAVRNIRSATGVVV